MVQNLRCEVTTKIHTFKIFPHLFSVFTHNCAETTRRNSILGRLLPPCRLSPPAHGLGWSRVPGRPPRPEGLLCRLRGLLAAQNRLRCSIFPFGAPRMANDFDTRALSCLDALQGTSRGVLGLRRTIAEVVSTIVEVVQPIAELFLPPSANRIDGHTLRKCGLLSFFRLHLARITRFCPVYIAIHPLESGVKPSRSCAA